MANAYPSSLEICEFLIESGAISGFPADYSQYDQARAAAIEEFERRTGYVPFLAETNDSTTVYRRWDSDFLDVRGGFVGITSVLWDDDVTSRTAYTDYFPLPENTKPIRMIEFISMPSTKITITGKRGYDTTLPDDVFKAILAYAASIVLTKINSTGFVDQVKVGDVSYTFGSNSKGSPSNQYAAWTDMFESCVMRYKRGYF